MRRLTRVEYELFDFEDTTPPPETLERQLRLHFEGAPTVYVSWTWERAYGVDSPSYSVGYSETSYFDDAPAHLLDVSELGPWRLLIGSEVDITHADPDCFTLKVASSEHAVFCASIDTDAVCVSTRAPF